MEGAGNLTEDELLAKAIALSMEVGVGGGSSGSAPGTEEQQPHSSTEQPVQSSTTASKLPGEPDSGSVGSTTEGQQQGGRSSQGAGGPGGGSNSRTGVSRPPPVDVEELERIVEGSEQLPPTHLSRLHSIHMWEPNPECMQMMLSMGISDNAAKRALYNTGNDSADLAVAWVFDNLQLPQLHEPFEVPATPVGDAPETFQSMDELFSETSHTMVFVVNASLKMGVGKVASQVAHAAVGLYARLLYQSGTSSNATGGESDAGLGSLGPSSSELGIGLRTWTECGSRKIVLKGENATHLRELKQRAETLRIPCLVVSDAGRTQVRGVT